MSFVRSPLFGLKMEVAFLAPPEPHRAVLLTRDPSSNPGAWLFLAMVFMAGMLFQACVPRLCHKGMEMGGQITH